MVIRIRAVLPAVLAVLAASLGLVPAAAAPWPGPGYVLRFYDGFTGTHLNTRLWTPGWFGTGITGPVDRAEIAAYRSANVWVSGGYLHLRLAHSPVASGGRTYSWTGALVTSNGHYSFTYGALAWRAYIPGAPGGRLAGWPALWAGGQHWPGDGEMDVLEGLGGSAGYRFHSAAGAAGRSVAGRWAGWHTFGVIWVPGRVTFFYDGRNAGTISEGITGSPMYLVMLYTIGHGSPPRAGTVLIDWVKAWQRR